MENKMNSIISYVRDEQLVTLDEILQNFDPTAFLILLMNGKFELLHNLIDNVILIREPTSETFNPSLIKKYYINK